MEAASTSAVLGGDKAQRIVDAMRRSVALRGAAGVVCARAPLTRPASA